MSPPPPKQHRLQAATPAMPDFQGLLSQNYSRNPNNSTRAPQQARPALQHTSGNSQSNSSFHVAMPSNELQENFSLFQTSPSGPALGSGHRFSETNTTSTTSTPDRYQGDQYPVRPDISQAEDDATANKVSLLMQADLERYCKKHFFLHADLSDSDISTFANGIATQVFGHYPSEERSSYVQSASASMIQRSRSYRKNYKAGAFAAFVRHISQCISNTIDLLSMDKPTRLAYCEQNFKQVALLSVFPYCRRIIDLDAIRQSPDPCNDLAKSTLLKEFLLNFYCWIFEKTCVIYMTVDMSPSNPQRKKQQQDAATKVKDFAASFCAHDRWRSLEIDILPKPEASSRGRPKKRGTIYPLLDLDSQFTFLTADTTTNIALLPTSAPTPETPPAPEDSLNLPDTMDDTLNISDGHQPETHFQGNVLSTSILTESQSGSQGQSQTQTQDEDLGLPRRQTHEMLQENINRAELTEIGEAPPATFAVRQPSPLNMQDELPPLFGRSQTEPFSLPEGEQDPVPQGRPAKKQRKRR